MRSPRDSRILLVILSLALAGLAGVLSVLLHGAWQAKQQAHDRNVQSALTATVRQLEADEIAGHAVSFITAGVDTCAAMLRGRLDDQGAHVVERDSIRIVHVQGSPMMGTKVAVFASLDTTLAGGTPGPAGERARLVEQLVGDIVRLEPRGITQRLSAGRIDSVLGANLQALDIEAVPRFAVVEASSGRPALSNLADPAPLLAGAAYRARLFPLDLSPPRYDLVVDLPGSGARVLAQVWPLGAASAAFLLVTALAFAHALRALGRQRRAAAHLVGFINNMTHEFKTPLATVSLACEALGRRQPDADTTRYLAMIRQENDRLGRQVEKILQVAQLERGGLVRGEEEVDLAAVAARSAAAFALQAEQRAGTLVAHLPEGPVRVTGDPLHLAAIIDNLLDNAVKYAQGAPP